MKFVIISAMQEESAFLSQNIPLINKKVVKEFGYEFIVGDYDLEKNIQVIIGVSGVGRVASGMLIANLNYYFNLTKDDYIVNIGTAGGIGNVNVGSVVVGIGSVYGDVNLAFFDSPYRYGQMCGCPLEFKGNEKLIEILRKSDLNLNYGHICTKESFSVDLDDCHHLIDTYFPDFNILAFDMESAAYSQACMRAGNNFLAVRYISDMIGMDGQSQSFDNSLAPSSVKALEICLYILNNL